MDHYPVLLDLQGRPAVVIGGGEVAERKVQGLREAGAEVTVIAPVLTPGLAALATARAIRHRARHYRAGDLAGVQIAIVATDNSTVTAAARREATRRGVWLNAADDPAHCDFILPAILRRGQLTVAVATGGASPALSVVVRDWLDAHLPREWEALAAAAAQVRRELRAAGAAPAAPAWRAALEREIYARLRGSLGVPA